MASTPASFFKGGKGIEAIKGTMLSPTQATAGCKFHERCPYVMERCTSTRPSCRRTVTTGL